MLKVALFLVAFVSQVSLAQSASHYMIVFGSQGQNNDARSAHTWATFVKATEQQILEEKTISWLPAQGYFGPNYTMPRLAMVPGRNYTLDETLRLSRSSRIMYWGPYKISPQFYQHASHRVAFLDRGQTNYKMFVLRDRLKRPALYQRAGGAINCIMAVSQLGGNLNTGTSWGFNASQQVLGFLSRNITGNRYQPAPDIATLLNLDRRIQRRGF